ncbi:MAG TPA: hypothetical protein VM784_03070 [Actinomycetota bacterium]|nr:hypothetical protein [Actinomycetota bacterium]
MTLLIAASIVLILGSAGTLVFGWTNQNESLIWSSIVFSLGAAIALAVAYVRSKRELARPAPAASGAGSEPSRWTLGSTEDAPAEPESGEGAPGAEEMPGDRPAEDETMSHEQSPEEPAPSDDQASVVPRSAAATSSEELSPLEAVGDAAPSAGAGVGAAATSPTKGRSTSKPKRKTASSGEVVAVADRKKYHRPECRYAKAAGGERITKAQARRRSYSACGICKP